jgi:hypothetical protein
MGCEPTRNLGMINLQNEQQTIVIKRANHHFNHPPILFGLNHNHSSNPMVVAL